MSADWALIESKTAMIRFASLFILLAALGAVAHGEDAPQGNAELHIAAGDWPWWRGPSQNGIAADGQDPPLEFSDSLNVLWKTPVPGRGHGSPIVVGSRVFLTTADADEKTQSLLCFDRKTGKQLWIREIHRGNFVVGGNAKSSLASSTPASDGERVFVSFINNAAVNASAVSIDGELLWQKKVCDYVLHQGFGASPAIYGPLVVFMGDNKGGGAIVGFDRRSGEEKWRRERPKKPNYPSPILVTISGRDQMLMTGCNLVTSFEPLTGKTIWEFPGSTTECVTSAVTDGERVFTSGGYPKNHLAAVRADGSGKVDWEKPIRVYVPSMLVRDGHLFIVTDAGVAMCRDSATGNEIWSSRLRGTFSASPVMVGDRIYAVNETGDAFVFRASPKAFEKLAENKLGDEVFATPTIAGGHIYLRVASSVGGKRQEMLYCVGKE